MYRAQLLWGLDHASDKVELVSYLEMEEFLVVIHIWYLDCLVRAHVRVYVSKRHRIHIQ